MPLKISIIIPTCNRRELLQKCLESLEQQNVPPGCFETIVVVDGSTDSTVDFLKDFSPPYAFTYLVQENKGPSTARNKGYTNASSDLILFLDDDMITSNGLIEAHLNAHSASPDSLIQGRVEIHESVRRTPFIRYEESLLNSFQNQLFESGKTMSSEDVAAGNISIKKTLLQEVGGFNESMPGFRNTDGELAYRLEKKNIPIIYANDAVSFMTHVKDFSETMKSSYAYGCSYVYMHKQHPETIWKFSPAVNDRNSLFRNVLRSSYYFKKRDKWSLGWLEKWLNKAVKISGFLRLGIISKPLYRLAKDYHFWNGVFEESAGQINTYVPKAIPILCYHHVAFSKHKKFRLYVLPIDKFNKQIDWLNENGYQPISLDQLHKYLTSGESIPEKSVVITFDDGYRDLKETAIPALVKKGFHHTHFINTGKTGKTTDWIDKAPDLPILSNDEIKELFTNHNECINFQAHGVNHLSCSELDDDTVYKETSDCINTLESVIEKPVRYMAYPYGEYNEETPKIMERLPLNCSFTVDQGCCRPGQNPHLIPRTEVFTNDFFIDYI
ncbi:MAG: hypothetical protein CMB97_00380, partial [Flavobacteriaceae bacterium]|nr:hypothetical protein [Flavobacteriaceae bacterium]